MASKDANFKILGASNHSLEERESNDFYSTDPDCVEHLLAVENFSSTVLEPCCGTGNIAEVLKQHGYSVISTDLIDRGYGVGGIDFFTHYKSIDSDVVTNPPFKLATEFVARCLDIMSPGKKLALFLKLQFLEGQDRFEKIYSQKKLEKIYVYTKRVACFKNNNMYQLDTAGNVKVDKDGNAKKMPSAVAYAWFVFNTSYHGQPQLFWINTPEDAQGSQKNKVLFNII